MARAWVKTIPVGVHRAPQGAVVATPERIRAWNESFQKMLGLGLRVPVPWSHRKDALPTTAEAKIRSNAGYCEDSRVDEDDALSFLVNVPGASLDDEGHLVSEEVGPDGVRRRVAVREVSAAVQDWRDGQARDWHDVVTHVALCTAPVVGGQRGFTPAELATAAPALYLSMSTLGDRTMADEAAVAEAEPTPAEIASEEVGKGGDAEKMLGVLSNLARLDLPLPEDTDDKNFIERLSVALEIAVHNKEKREAEDQATQAQAGQQAPVTEESRPVMMSTLSKDLSDRERRMLGKQQADHRNALAGRIDKLVKLGLPAEKANKLKGQLTTYTLAVDESLAAVPQVVDEVVGYLEDALKALPPDRKTLSTLTEQPNPAAAAADAERTDPKEIEERAARVSRHQGESRWDRMKNGKK